MRKIFLKMLYGLGILKPYWKIDRIRYVKRLSSPRVAYDWRHAASKDAAQFSGREVVCRLSGLPVPVYFYCDWKGSLNEVDVMKTSPATLTPGGPDRRRWHILEIGMNMIRPGTLVMDVGANIGVYGLPWAALDETVTVYCFEPNPMVRSRLDRNIALNRLSRNVVSRPEALSDKTGAATLYADDGLSSLNPDVSGAKDNPVQVPLARLDDVIDTNGRPVSLIKIDVQGHEFEVMRGALGVMKTFGPALIFEHEDDLFRSRAAAEKAKHDIELLLSSVGYGAFLISFWGPDLMAPVDWSRPLDGDVLALPLRT